MSTRTIICTILISALLAPYSAAAYVSQVQYATLFDIAADGKAIIDYKGPQGESFFSCSPVDGTCFTLPGFSTSTPTANESILSSIDFSPADGAWVVKKGVSRDGTKAIFVTSANQLAVHDIAAGQTNVSGIDQTDLPFFSISPRGTYVAAYNYSRETNRIWNTITGATYEIPSEIPGFVEFSDDESTLAYLAEDGDHSMLYTMKTSALDQEDENEGAAISKDEFSAADYIFADNVLFFISNKDSAYDWNLYSYDPSGKAIDTVQQNVSYGEYLRTTGSALLYTKVVGSQAHLFAHYPSSGKTIPLNPLAPSARGNADAEIVETKHAQGVLWTPDNNAPVKNLFVWLHGGPERQTSVGYHPYLSYAVYDELLEQLMGDDGAVLRIDYTGSDGYGTDFKQELHGSVGDKDVRDVLEMTELVQEDLDADNVFLIGNSYGGYLSLRTAVEAPKEFDGAISVNGVTDWESLIERIPSSPFSIHFDGVPSRKTNKKYREASVYDRISKLKGMPVVVAYGTKDTTVPIWQSTEFYQLATDKKIDATLVPLVEEDHIPRKQDSLNFLCEEIVESLDLDSGLCR